MKKENLLKKIILLTICIIYIFALNGCWDKHELEDNTFIILLGIDKGDTNKNIMITVSFPLTQAGSSGEKKDGGGGDYSVMSAEAPTIVEGLHLLSTKLAGPLALYSVRTIIISQELAESDLLNSVFSSWRYEQMGSTTSILISNCKAAEFIEARVKDPLIDPLRQEDLLLEQNNNSAYYKPVQFLDLIQDSKSNSACGVAMYGGIEAEQIPVKAENETQICGLAVFRDAKMAGTLDSSEAQTYSMLTRSKSKKLLTLPDPLDSNSNISVEIMPDGKNKIKSSIRSGIPVFNINVNLRCNVECIQSSIDYTSQQNYNILTDYIKNVCTENMRNLVNKVQKEYNADILKLGNNLAYHFLTTNEWKNYNWNEKYKDAEINLNVNLDLNRAGILMP